VTRIPTKTIDETTDIQAQLTNTPALGMTTSAFSSVLAGQVEAARRPEAARFQRTSSKPWPQLHHTPTPAGMD